MLLGGACAEMCSRERSRVSFSDHNTVHPHIACKEWWCDGVIDDDQTQERGIWEIHQGGGIGGGDGGGGVDAIFSCNDENISSDDTDSDSDAPSALLSPSDSDSELEEMEVARLLNVGDIDAAAHMRSLYEHDKVARKNTLLNGGSTSVHSNRKWKRERCMTERLQWLLSVSPERRAFFFEEKHNGHEYEDQWIRFELNR